MGEKIHFSHIQLKNIILLLSSSGLRDPMGPLPIYFHEGVKMGEYQLSSLTKKEPSENIQNTFVSSYPIPFSLYLPIKTHKYST